MNVNGTELHQSRRPKVIVITHGNKQKGVKLSDPFTNSIKTTTREQVGYRLLHPSNVDFGRRIAQRNHHERDRPGKSQYWSHFLVYIWARSIGHHQQ